MKLSESQVRDIFFSGTHSFKSDEELVIKLHFLLTQHYLSCDRIVISEKQEYFSLCDNTKIIAAHDEAAGGGTSHVVLKLLAQQYLASLGISVYFEQSFCGFYPDVISTDRQTIVECGHTNNADKIFTYFTQGNIAELIQIPYPTDEDAKVYGYRFTASSELRGFLDTEFQENKKNLLKIINRKS